MKHLNRLALLLCVLLVGTALVVPQTGLNYMETRFTWLGSGVAWLKTAVPGWDMDHLVAFALLGWTARLAIPQLRVVHLVLALTVFAGLTEIAQIWVPGRTASVRDAALDVVGGLLGYVSMAVALWRGRSAPTPALPRRGRE